MDDYENYSNYFLKFNNNHHASNASTNIRMIVLKLMGRTVYIG